MRICFVEAGSMAGRWVKIALLGFLPPLGLVFRIKDDFLPAQCSFCTNDLHVASQYITKHFKQATKQIKATHACLMSFSTAFQS